MADKPRGHVADTSPRHRQIALLRLGRSRQAPYERHMTTRTPQVIARCSSQSPSCHPVIARGSAAPSTRGKARSLLSSPGAGHHHGALHKRRLPQRAASRVLYSWADSGRATFRVPAPRPLPARARARGSPACRRRSRRAPPQRTRSAPPSRAQTRRQRKLRRPLPASKQRRCVPARRLWPLQRRERPCGEIGRSRRALRFRMMCGTLPADQRAGCTHGCPCGS
jgi:hypothetical protein